MENIAELKEFSGSGIYTTQSLNGKAHNLDLETLFTKLKRLPLCDWTSKVTLANPFTFKILFLFSKIDFEDVQITFFVLSVCLTSCILATVNPQLKIIKM